MSIKDTGAEKNNSNIKVYGADWCSHTQETLSHLEQIGIEYQYIDVEQDKKASEWVKEQNGGMEIKPTLDIRGQVVTAPSNGALDNLLRNQKLMK